jgi:hypothetical protein
MKYLLLLLGASTISCTYSLKNKDPGANSAPAIDLYSELYKIEKERGKNLYPLLPEEKTIFNQIYSAETSPVKRSLLIYLANFAQELPVDKDSSGNPIVLQGDDVRAAALRKSIIDALPKTQETLSESDTIGFFLAVKLVEREPLSLDSKINLIKSISESGLATTQVTKNIYSFAKQLAPLASDAELTEGLSSVFLEDSKLPDGGGFQSFKLSSLLEKQEDSPSKAGLENFVKCSSAFSNPDSGRTFVENNLTLSYRNGSSAFLAFSSDTGCPESLETKVSEINQSFSALQEVKTSTSATDPSFIDFLLGRLESPARIKKLTDRLNLFFSENTALSSVDKKSVLDSIRANVTMILSELSSPVSVTLEGLLDSHAPSDILLSSFSFDENHSAAYQIGILSAIDQDENSAFIFSLEPGSLDNEQFFIGGNVLKKNLTSDFEEDSSFSVRIRVTDERGLSFIKDFNLSVLDINEDPSSLALSNLSVPENEPANTVIGLLSATDPDANSLFTYSLTPGTGGTDNEYFNIHGNSLRITAPADYEAKSSFSVRIRVSDAGGRFIEEAYSITVTDVNETPFISNVLPQNTNEDTSLVSISVTIGDPDGALACVAALSGSSDNPSVLLSSSIVIGGTYPNCSMSLAPVANANGSANVSLVVTDGFLSASDNFDFTVNAVNDTPTITASGDTSKTLSEDDASSSINLAMGTDVDISTNSQTLLYVIVTSPTKGTIGSFPANAASSGNTISYTPSANANGSDSFTYRICDNFSPQACTANQTVSLSIAAVNDTPTIATAGDTSKTLLEDASATSINLARGADVDISTNSQTLSYVIVTSPTKGSLGSFPANAASSGNTISYTPSANANGSDSFAYRICDNFSPQTCTANQTVSLSITAVNDAPTISSVSGQSTSEDTVKSGVTFTISDIDTTLACSSSVSKSSSNTSLLPVANITTAGTAPNCTVSLTPAANINGSSSVTLTVSDGALTASTSFTLTVSAVNDAPTISGISPQTFNEDSSTTVTFSISDIDNSLTCSGSVSSGSNNTALVTSARITISGTAPSCSAVVSPFANANGAATVTLTVSDGSATASSSFTITVNPTPDAPVANNLSYGNTSYYNPCDLVFYLSSVSTDTAAPWYDLDGDFRVSCTNTQNSLSITNATYFSTDWSTSSSGCFTGTRKYTCRCYRTANHSYSGTWSVTTNPVSGTSNGNNQISNTATYSMIRLNYQTTVNVSFGSCLSTSPCGTVSCDGRSYSNY